MGETGIARRLPFDLARQKIVGRTGQPDGGAGVLLGLNAGRGDGEHGKLDAGLVHRFEPHAVELNQPLREPLLDLCRRVPARSAHGLYRMLTHGIPGEIGRNEMLL